MVAWSNLIRQIPARWINGWMLGLLILCGELVSHGKAREMEDRFSFFFSGTSDRSSCGTTSLARRSSGWWPAVRRWRATRGWAQARSLVLRSYPASTLCSFRCFLYRGESERLLSKWGTPSCSSPSPFLCVDWGLELICPGKLSSRYAGTGGLISRSRLKVDSSFRFFLAPWIVHYPLGCLHTCDN